MRIVFMGSPAIAAESLAALVSSRHQVALVVSQADKPAGRGRRLTSPPVADLARDHGIPVAQPRSARTPELGDAIAAAAADIGVVVAYGKILPPAVLEAFPRGVVNVHTSLLPRYRGAAPAQWAIIRGERTTGVTIMQLDEGMDTGPMIAREEVAITDDDTAETLLARLAPVGARLLVSTLDDLEHGRATFEAQDDAAATYAPMLKKDDGRIDWTRPATEIANLVRGVDPWPGAHTTFEGMPLKLFAPRAVAGRGEPGEILAVRADGLVIACGEGACVVGQLQVAGKRRMSAADFARGKKLAPGMRLGSPAT
ncbi:MAG TPA: methionyl-tRNA formyltransferase [Kofleriaceae bacterium]|nr:methionyl-tRNA formyltransferase [Kofleriaceae bacterium]